MSNNKTSHSRPSYRDLQAQIESFRKKRDKLNQKTKEYINGLQKIEEEIYNHLKTARDVYKKKRDMWNKRVKKLKSKKIEYKNLLDDLFQEKRKIQRSRGKEQPKYVSIKQLDYKIENLERIIETENLSINEENEIIDQISSLAEKKNNQLETQHSDDLYKIERKMELVKINLDKIYAQLNKWSSKSQEYHSKMLDLYKKANELKDEKKKMEEDLIENKKEADRYHEKFLDVMKERKRLYGRQPRYRSKRKGSQRKKGQFRRSNKNKQEIEQIKQDKLATALEKQKAGKKLNIFEARLILEKSGK